MFEKLFEDIEYKCMENMVKPMVHVDEFSSKMGDDADIIVVSFYVRDEKAAQDLAHWFETGYQEVLDADTSPGELKPNRYLVYVEMRRRTNAGKVIARMLDDLESLTEYKPADWQFKYQNTTFPFTRENFDHVVPLSPHGYRETHEEELNEWRIRAGLDTRPIYDTVAADIRQLQNMAGIG